MEPMKALKLAASIGVCELTGFIGAIFAAPSISGWYAGLAKPSFSPPNWVFAPVWTFLFLLMGIALFLVWEKGIDGKNVKKAMQVFGIQLGLNLLWSILFFGLRSPLYGLLEIILLWAAIVLTISEFSKVSRNAGLLLIPYIAWVSIAMMLNLSIYLLNA
jgi:translocator protein